MFVISRQVCYQISVTGELEGLFGLAGKPNQDYCIGVCSTAAAPTSRCPNTRPLTRVTLFRMHDVPNNVMRDGFRPPKSFWLWFLWLLFIIHAGGSVAALLPNTSAFPLPCTVKDWSWNFEWTYLAFGTSGMLKTRCLAAVFAKVFHFSRSVCRMRHATFFHEIL